MCGIYAQLGSFKLNDALKCLKKLEYRGYDSYGIGYDNNIIYKKVGRISFFDKNNDITVTKAICHTRWATNGKVSEKNAHPHSSSNNDIILVHNGILENEDLIKNTFFINHKFKSDTDSEVVAELLSLFIRKYEPFDAIKRVMEIIKGSYAIIFMIKDDPNIYYIKNKSSLIIGYNDKDYYLASDIYAFPQNTKFYKHLSDGSYGRIGPGLYSNDNNLFIPYDFDFKEQKEHIMLDEIEEEKKLAQNLYENFEVSNDILNLIYEAKEFVLIGSGSSYYAAEYIAKMIEEKLQKRARAFLPSEFEYNDIYKDGTFIFISQSGETADVLNAIDSINPKRALLLTNRIESQMAIKIKNVIDIKAGIERAVASTKSFNQSVLAFYLLINKIKAEESSKIKTYIRNLDEIKNSFDQNIAKLISKMDNVFYLGQGYDYIISKEGALKLKEIAYIPTEGYSISELKHGSLALVSPQTMVIGLSSGNSFFLPCLNEVKARGGHVLFIENKFKDHTLGALALSRYVQLIAYYTSLEKGNNPDFPRNLAKSVTVI